MSNTKDTIHMRKTILDFKMSLFTEDELREYVREVELEKLKDLSSEELIESYVDTMRQINRSIK